MRYLWVFFLLLFTVQPASAQYVGLSAFAANNPNFPCDQYLQIAEASKYPAIAILWGTYGNDYSCLTRFVEKFRNRYHFVLIHLTNETCRPPRGNPCGTDELYRGTNVPTWNRYLAEHDPYVYQAIADRIANILAVVNSIGTDHTTVMLTEGLEDNYDAAAYTELHPFVRARWPYLLARNPVGGNKDGSVYFGDYRERHRGSASCKGASAVVNEDGDTGQGAADSRRFVERNAKRCVATFVWRARHQGRIGNFRILPPEKRTFEITATDVKTFRQIFSAYK